MIFIKNDIISSSGKNIGYVEIEEEKISIFNNSKPMLQISNKQHIKSILHKNIEIIEVLYDDYLLTISEIASLFFLSYNQTYKILKQFSLKTNPKQGRRNSSYGSSFTQVRKDHISQALKGKPATSTYIRTPEIKQKISNALKEGYRTGRIKQNPELQSKAWADGKYATAKMGRSIQGFFHSIKMNKDMYFRSLLELNFLVLIENEKKVKTYKTEPFQIKLPHKKHYTPDIIINNNLIIELKPKNFSVYTNFDRFCLEIAGLNKFCNENNYSFCVVYDKDIGFDSKKYRQFLKNNPDIIQKYNIRFKKQL